MKTLLIFIFAFSISFSGIAQERNYISSADTTDAETFVVPEEVLHPDYSLDQNGEAYYADGEAVPFDLITNIELKGWCMEKIKNVTGLQYSRTEHRNKEYKETIPISEKKIAYLIMIFSFLYFFSVLFLMSRHRGDALTIVAAVAAIVVVFVAIVVAVFVVAVVAVAVAVVFVVFAIDLNKKNIYKVFFIVSLVCMGIIWGIFGTPIFFVTCLFGGGLGILLAKLKKKKEN